MYNKQQEVNFYLLIKTRVAHQNRINQIESQSRPRPGTDKVEFNKLDKIRLYTMNFNNVRQTGQDGRSWIK